VVKPSPQVAAALDSAAKAAGVEPALVRAVSFAESTWNPLKQGPVTSHGWRAKGLMQLGPDVIKDMHVTDPFDPSQNALAGARFLATLLKRYGSLSKAVAAYNFGPTNVDNGKTYPSETTTYVARVLDRLDVERKLAGGAAPPPLPLPSSQAQHSLQCASCGAPVVVVTDLRVKP
jgi:soluble lytic murein transglycosylase-like protein